jgi:hypothetical protein
VILYPYMYFDPPDLSLHLCRVRLVSKDMNWSIMSSGVVLRIALVQKNVASFANDTYPFFETLYGVISLA